MVSIFQGIERARADGEHVHDSLVQSARSLAVDEDNLLSSAEQIARAVSNVTAVRAVRPDCDTVLKEALVGITYFGNLARVDRNGLVVCSALPAARGLSVASIPIFHKAKQSYGFVVSSVLPTAVLQNSVIAGMLTLRSPGGQFNGTLTIALNSDWLDSLMRGHAASEDAIVFAFDRDRHILSSNNRTVAQALVGGLVPGQDIGDLKDATDSNGNGWTFTQTRLRSGSIFIAYGGEKSALFGTPYVSVAADFLLPVF